MTRIHLIRHASPRIEPGVPASRWRLSPAGVEEAVALAGIARGWDIEALYSSVEAKAQSTGAIIGDALALPVHVAEGFEEQHWDAWVENADAFNDAVRHFLEQPDDRIGGSESASAAARRFDAALRSVATDQSPLAVVSHGRVLTAWLTQATAMESPFEVWRAMPMPAYCTIERAHDGRVRVVEPFRGLPATP